MGDPMGRKTGGGGAKKPVHPGPELARIGLLCCAMALPSTRYEFRLRLSHVDRGIDWQGSAIAARHPSETAEHLMLRVLAYCLLFDERLEFGPGLCDPEAADLWARDLTGQITTWVECGAADPDKVRRVFLHHSAAQVHAVLVDPRRCDELLSGVATWKKTPRGRAVLGVWMVDPTLLAQLAGREERRQTWNVTLVGDHAYIEIERAGGDAGSLCLDGPIAASFPLDVPPGR